MERRYTIAIGPAKVQIRCTFNMFTFAGGVKKITKKHANKKEKAW